MASIAVVIAVLLAVELGLVRALGLLTARYDDATGYERPHRQTSWLKPMSGERPGFGGAARRISPSERILAAIVVAAALAFEIWFFFFAGSSLPHTH
jgi:hypothetical protein